MVHRAGVQGLWWWSVGRQGSCLRRVLNALKGQSLPSRRFHCGRSTPAQKLLCVTSACAVTAEATVCDFRVCSDCRSDCCMRVCDSRMCRQRPPERGPAAAVCTLRRRHVPAALAQGEPQGAPPAMSWAPWIVVASKSLAVHRFVSGYGHSAHQSQREEACNKSPRR